MTSESAGLTIEPFEALPSAVCATAVAWSAPAVQQLGTQLAGLLQAGTRTVLIDLTSARGNGTANEAGGATDQGTLLTSLSDLLRTADSRLIIGLVAPPDDLESHLQRQKIPDYLIRIFTDVNDAIDGLSDATHRPLPSMRPSRMIEPPMESWMESVMATDEQTPAPTMPTTPGAPGARAAAAGPATSSTRILNTTVRTLPDSPGIVVLQLSGVLDADTVARLDEQLDALITRGTQSFVFDMGPLRFVNSTGLGSLVRFADEVEKRGGRIALARLGSAVRPVIEMLGLHRYFQVRDTVAEAEAHVLAGPRGLRVAPAGAAPAPSSSSANGGSDRQRAPFAPASASPGSPAMMVNWPSRAAVGRVTTVVARVAEACTVRLSVPGCVVTPVDVICAAGESATFHVTPLASGTHPAQVQWRTADSESWHNADHTLPVVGAAPSRDLARLGVGLLVLAGLVAAGAAGGALAIVTAGAIGGGVALVAAWRLA
ncbi:MAG: STAS domain-containing protein [Planctomycetota bacterium]